MAISGELGDERSVELSGGVIRYRERGEGPAIVFVHGLLVNGDLWRKVVPRLAATHRCVTPDWPLGAHAEPMRPGADLSPVGVARLVGEFLAALDLRDVTVVANDTGGAITQILMTRWPERIGRVVLTPSDCFERFFPPPFSTLPRLLRIPGMTWLLSRVGQLHPLHRTPLVFGLVTRRAIPREIVRSYLGPMRRSAGVRHDLRRFVTGVHRRYTLAAAERLPAFDRPVLLAWASEDRLFPLALARRLAAVLPNARLVEIPDSYTFVPEDQPDRLVELIGATTAGGFAERHPTHPAGPVEDHPGGADLDGSPAVR